MPDLLFMVCALVTSFALGWYPVLLMMNKWKEVKSFYLRFYYEERTFQAGKIRRYQKDEFVQKKQSKKQTLSSNVEKVDKKSKTCTATSKSYRTR